MRSLLKWVRGFASMTGLWAVGGAAVGALLMVGVAAVQGRLARLDELAFGAISLGVTGLYAGAVFSAALSLAFRRCRSHLSSSALWAGMGGLAGAMGYVTLLLMNGVPFGQLIPLLRSGAGPFLGIMALGGSAAGLAVSRAVADRSALDSGERDALGCGGEP